MIDIGGGDSRLVDRLVTRGLSCVSVLDLSVAALARAKARLGPSADRVRWIEADVTSRWFTDPVDVWHDRAVFHFLIDEKDRAQYTEQARRHIKPGGHLLLATFSSNGPTKCSGLPVVRYDTAGLAAELGSSFALARTIDHLHTTPAGLTQPFTYALFRLLGTATPSTRTRGDAP